MYTRVFTKILDSSINIQTVDPAFRWLWITMLLIADDERTGVVDMPIERLAARAGLSVEDTEAGIKFLQSPDPDSESDDEEGRRIIPIRESGRGWQLVNWVKYQTLMKAEQRRIETRERVAKHRAKKSGNAFVTKCNPSDADATTDADTLKTPPLSPKGEGFSKFWQAYPKKKSKGQAMVAWKQLAPDEKLLGEMLSGLERAKKSLEWKKDGGQFIPYPATWLRARGWEDEYPKTIIDPRTGIEKLNPVYRDTA